MKDVEKTNVERQNSKKRMRRRKRMMNVYVLVVVLLVLTAMITISYTFLFNIHEIRVSGASNMYTAQEIVEASGIKEGDNLMRLDPRKAEQAILDKLLYVESADIGKDWPSSVQITVTPCIPAYNVNYEGGTLLLSKKGKILADNGFITEGLPVIYGYEPADPVAGKPIRTENEHKDEAFTELIRSLGSNEGIEISAVDMTDEFNIVVSYSNGSIFRMGTYSDVEYKLSLAQTVMNDESVNGRKGYLTMIGSNQCSFRMSNDPADVIGEPATAAATDANGQPVDVQGETNADQQQMFSEYNNTQGGGEEYYGGDEDGELSYDDDYYDDGYYGDDQYYDDGEYYDDGQYYEEY
jgi:cell division septal protein FtsQ